MLTARRPHIWRHRATRRHPSETFAQLHRRKPEEAVRRAVRGMLPKNRLGRRQLTKLKVYAGPTHPHAAQKPQPLEVAHARHRPA